MISCNFILSWTYLVQEIITEYKTPKIFQAHSFGLQWQSLTTGLPMIDCVYWQLCQGDSNNSTSYRENEAASPLLLLFSTFSCLWTWQNTAFFSALHTEPISRCIHTSPHSAQAALMECNELQRQRNMKGEERTEGRERGRELIKLLKCGQEPDITELDWLEASAINNTL